MEVLGQGLVLMIAGMGIVYFFLSILGHRLLLSLDSHRRHKGLDERHRKVRFDLPEGNAQEGPCGQGGL